MNPASVRAVAPVTRFCTLLNFGSTVLRLVSFGVVMIALLATTCLNELSVVKYSALPNPVRSALGSVPRHKDAIGLGPARIERRVSERVWAPDCCTRVLRRSAGCRRTAEDTPEQRPATKWKVG